MSKDSRFFAALFDFSFSRFITPKVVGLLYVLVMLFAGVILLGIISSGFNNGFLSGLGSLIVAPIVALTYLLFARLSLEALVAGIKTAENTSEMKQYLKSFLDKNNSDS